MKILVTYDGTLNSKDALIYGIKIIRQRGGKLLLLSVFNRGLFTDYEGGPDAERIAREDLFIHIQEARKIIDEMASGYDVRLIEREGNPEDVIIEYAKAEGVDLLITTPKYKSLLKKAPCPVTFIPGTILMAVDHTDSYEVAIDEVIRESRDSHSKVILLGVVPVHIYSRSEREEIERMRRETLNNLKKVKKILANEKIEVEEIMREGFVDEEISRCADKYNASMVIIPVNREMTSELNKAAEILSEERELIKSPLLTISA